MRSVEIRETDPQQILAQMTHLVGEAERRSFFERRPDLVNREQLTQACSEVARQVQINAERAIELAKTARYLADRVDDDAGRALAARACANAFHFSGEHEEAQELYEAALDLFLAQGDSLAAAITRSSALQNLAYLGDYARVHTWERAARTAFEAAGDRLRLAILDHNFANVLYRQAHWQEALERYDSAYREFQRLERHEDAAVCLNNVAACHIDLHHPDEALAIYGESRAYCQAQGLDQLVMEVDYHVAYLSYLRAEYNRAVHLFQRARREAVAAGDEYQLGLCDLDLSEIYLELNMVDDAAELARSAFECFDRLKMPHESAKALTNRAVAASRLARTDPALDLLRRARAIFVLEQNQLWPALIDFYRAVVLVRAERFAEAEEPARAAARVFDRSGLESRAIMCELVLASLLLGLGDLAAASEACQRASRRLDGLDLPALEERAYRLSGQVEEARGNLDAAFEAYRTCDQWLEKVRSQLRGEDLKIAFFEDKQSIYESLFWLSSRAVEDPRRFENAFEYIEKAKSRTLADLLAFEAHSLPARSRGGGPLAERVKSLREDLSWLYRQQDLRIIEGQADAGEIGRLRAHARRLEDDLLRAQRELEASDLELSSIQNASMVDLRTVRESLPEDTTLVEYFLARGRIHACVIDRNRLELVDVAAIEPTRKAHRLLQFQLSRAQSSRHLPGIESLLERATTAHSRQLYDLLVAPIEARLDRRRLLIAPHGFLHYVPFHALLDPSGTPLIERFPVCTTPSASVFHLGAIREKSFEARSLVLAVPDERAPQILEEARAVAAVAPSARLFEGEAATREVLETHAAGCRYVHIATHGIFRRDNPMFSAIQLGDQRLGLFDLFNLRLDAELVVLSGCGTGLAAVRGADELLGLTRGLLFAGARSALVTLWDVHDESTALFMQRFYGHLAAEHDSADALRLAMLDHRRDHPQPYYWAPFVLVGQPGPGGNRGDRAGQQPG